jgi:hypothetical protein
MSKQFTVLFICVASMAVAAMATSDVLAQRGGGGRGGAAGGRSAGHVAQGGSRHGNAGPAMSRPGGGAPTAPGKIGGAPKPSIGGGVGTPNGGFERPTAGKPTPPKVGSEGPRVPGNADRPNIGGARPNVSRPNVPGKTDRPNLESRPGGGVSSTQLNDFLGGGGQGADRPDLGQPGRPNIGKDDRPNISRDDLPKLGEDDPKLNRDNLPNVGDRGNNSTNINVGDVNIGNSVDYSKNQQAWVDNHRNTGNQVRVNAGNRYTSAYNNGAYRHGAVGGYPYYGGWNNRGAYYGWRPVTYAAFGTFMGAAWVSAQPRYYAYGDGGNVYYENNVVYVDGQAAGTPEEYAAQSTALVASAPEQVTDTEWLPLGVFALTREGVNDSQAMLELAVNKQGVLSGTYYNEATEVTRSLKGMLDQDSQRAAIGFADGKNADVVLETGIQNLTQDEAPALLHQGKDRSGPVLLVRLQAPEEEQK